MRSLLPFPATTAAVTSRATWRSLSCVGVNNSPPLKGRPAQGFSTVHVPQRDNAFLHTDPKLRRQRCSRVCLTFRQGKALPLCI
jgi:hypothetical protein